MSFKMFTSFAFICSILYVTFAETITLPKGVQPEGVTSARGSNIFISNIRNGAIYLIDTATELITTAVPPQENRTAFGLDFDGNRLFVAGSGSNFLVKPSLHVYNSVTGRTIASCVVKKNGFVNDVVVSGSYAYYTDSFEGVLYRMNLASLPMCDIDTISLPRPAFKPEVGVYKANGIAPYKGGLLVSNSALGTIFFIDIQNENRVQKILPNGSVPSCDGIDVERKAVGSVLYVAQSSLATVSAWELEIDGRNRWIKPTFLKTITSPDFDGFVTSISFADGKMVSANPRFNVVPSGGVFTVGVIEA